MSDTRATKGLYGKFIVTRTDGTDAPGEKHHGCTYFVLDLQHDKHMPPALRAYAESCEKEYPALARDLRQVAADFNSRAEFAGITAQKIALDLERQVATTEVGEWKVLRDPARPNWPGVLVVPSDNSSLVHVEAGRPVNFADSVALAKRLVEALRVAPVSEAGAAPTEKQA